MSGPAATSGSKNTERYGAKVSSSGGGAPRAVRKVNRVLRDPLRASAEREADLMIDGRRYFEIFAGCADSAMPAANVAPAPFASVVAMVWPIDPNTPTLGDIE